MKYAVVIILLLAGCAAPLTQRAASVQVLRQDSAVATTCKKLGPVAITNDDGFLKGPTVADEDAVNAARDKVAEMGGDSFVRTNTDYRGYTIVVHGIALRCYDVNKDTP